jgi:hypothetical protein
MCGDSVLILVSILKNTHEPIKHEVMKKFILIAVLFTCCKKENRSVATTSIHVVESITNLPVSGVTVRFMRCNFGCPFGPKILFRGITDANGVCQVPSEHYNDATSEMQVLKEKYWPFSVQKNTTVSITPEGWLQLAIHKAKIYPAGTSLYVNLVNQSGSWSHTMEHSTETDTLFLITAFGGQQHHIDWQVLDTNRNAIKSGTLNGLQIPRFDTLKNITLDY